MGKNNEVRNTEALISCVNCIENIQVPPLFNIEQNKFQSLLFCKKPIVTFDKLKKNLRQAL